LTTASKSIYVLEGTYRNRPIENTQFELVKAYQPYPHKEGGFVTVKIDDLDTDKNAFNFRNGTFDLKEGRFREHRPEDFITVVVPYDYDPDADCPMFRKSLDLWMDGDQEKIKFIQRFMGSILSGEIRDHALVIFEGPTGENGKSTFIKAMKVMLGDYQDTIPAETLLSSRTTAGQSREDLAKLKGRRLVWSNEADAGRRLAESLVKLMTGGDDIATRHLYGRYFPYTPQFKLLLATNHKPKIQGTDNAIWRRIKLLPWEVTIPKKQKDMSIDEKLAAEAPGIFNFAYEGYRKWVEEGLGDFAAVDSATAEYRMESDVFMAFYNECCVEDEESEIQAGVLYANYRDWCENNDEHPISQTAFGLRIKELGIQSRESKRRKFYQGIRCDRGDRID